MVLSKKLEKNSENGNCSPEEKKVLRFFEVSLHFLLFLLIIALLIIIVKELYILLFKEIFNLHTTTVMDSILFIFILIELFTILYAYLRKGYIKVERIVEVGIISLVRDAIFHVNDMPYQNVYAFSLLLLVLGAIFFIEKFFSKDRDE